MESSLVLGSRLDGMTSGVLSHLWDSTILWHPQTPVTNPQRAEEGAAGKGAAPVGPWALLGGTHWVPGGQRHGVQAVLGAAGAALGTGAEPP